MFQLSDLADALLNNDKQKIHAIIEEVTDKQGTTIIKCLGCGEVVAFEQTDDLIYEAMQPDKTWFKYLVLKHMVDCKRHDVYIPPIGETGFEYHISQYFEGQFKLTCKQFGKNYDEELPGIAERWRPDEVT